MIVLDLATETEAEAHAASTTLTAELVEALRRFPGGTVSDDDSTLSFAALHEAALRRSGVLRGMFSHGDPALLRSRNSIDFVIDLLAYLLTGLQPVLTVGATVSSAELHRIRACATTDSDDDRSAVALYLTPGVSTGDPESIPRTHADCVLTLWLAARNAELTPYDCYLASTPVAHHHVLGCPGILGALLSGARVVLTQATDYAGIVAAIARHRVTVLPLTLAQARRWYGRVAQADSPVRLVQIGGPAPHSADVDALRRLFGATVQILTPDGRLRTAEPATAVDERRFAMHPADGDMINRGGESVAPADVEHVVAQCPLVIEVLAVGAPHTIFGEMVLAYVTTTEPVPGSVVLGWLLRHCRDISVVPDRVVTVERIPRPETAR
ncbi:hypothetical protein ACIP5Y_04785 [Nocardia sp. NPDC088792]|uniref:AMP-binding enzyme n=1 Tax=Nocardia sp. NPDC088792 TaxID=3364332 RepID=UPI0038108813